MVTLFFISSQTYGFLAFLMTFAWGLQDALINTQLTELLGFEFDDNTRPFSCFNIFQSLSLFVFLSCEAFVKTKSE